jgi:hypothetical protein
VDLRNPRFPNPQHCSNFFHGEFFEVIKRENLAFARLEFTYRAGQDFAKFPLQTFFVGFLFEPLGRRG